MDINWLRDTLMVTMLQRGWELDQATKYTIDGVGPEWAEHVREASHLLRASNLTRRDMARLLEGDSRGEAYPKS